MSVASIRADDWRDVRPADWRWAYFTAQELACRQSGQLLVAPDFLDRLEKLRIAFARPLIVNSGYRTPEHNARVSTTGRDGPHTTGRAVDIAIDGADAFVLVKLALGFGFTGLGVAQKGASRFIHLDDLAGPHPRPRVWSY